MTKSTSLASDVSFIKEFEELRLKQKLLIESLKKKESSKEENLLVDINTKLEFLVNLFKDAEEDSSHDEHNDENFKKIFERLDEIETNINDRLLQLEKSHEELKVKHDELPQKVDEISTSKLPPPPTDIKVNETELPKKDVLSQIPPTPKKESMESSQTKPEQSSQTPQSSRNMMPPKPDFSADQTKEKKKKWF